MNKETETEKLLKSASLVSMVYADMSAKKFFSKLLPSRKEHKIFDHHKFKAIRELRCISRTELMNAADLTLAHISRLENGKCKDPGISIVARIAEALDVPIESLLTK